MNSKDELVEPRSAPVVGDNLLTLEKQLRDKDIAFKKEKALLAQKIELLNIQLKDAQEREESTRRLHDTMFSAFKQDPKDGQLIDRHNFDNLLKEYESKIVSLTERNFILESGLNQPTQNPSSNNNPIGDADTCKDVAIERLSNALEQLKMENKELREENELYLSTDTEQRAKNRTAEHQTYIKDFGNRYESSLASSNGLQRETKTLVKNKLDSKQTFTFGEKTRKNVDSETQSNYSLKDEIDKLHFMVEEKDYMNAELKQEVTELREQLARLKQRSRFDENSDQDYHRELSSLCRENKRLQDDLNKTEDNYNEQ